jgi:phosphoribosyl 1,2-cyclic phosphodiesterase
MQVKFWGVRGSTPTPQLENMRYGGNTSCVEVRVGNALLVFDCGTGLRPLGKRLSAEFGDRETETHVFISHFHWDHIQGIPFFKPLYDNPHSSFIFHSSSQDRGLQRVLEDQMVTPYFPVNMSEMSASRQFFGINGRVQIGQRVTVDAVPLNHPQGCLGFRVESADGVLVYATDNEPGHEQFDKDVRKLAAGADLLIYDAQYLPDEYVARKRGWGHSHWREAVDIVMESGAKELVLFHHDPDHNDACIDSIVKEARNYYPKVRAAAEGLELRIVNG